MKYMLLIYSDRSGWDSLSEDEQKAIHGEYMAISDHPGIRHHNQLQPASTVTTVRVQDGATLTTDGPFVEGKEHLGGFSIVKAPDLDAALEWGRKLAVATTLPIEVRPFQDEAED